LALFGRFRVNFYTQEQAKSVCQNNKRGEMSRPSKIAQLAVYFCGWC